MGCFARQQVDSNSTYGAGNFIVRRGLAIAFATQLLPLWSWLQSDRRLLRRTSPRQLLPAGTATQNQGHSASLTCLQQRRMQRHQR